jgi:putative membrane protein
VLLRDTLLAWAHFVAVFALVSTVVAELILYRSRMGLARLKQLQRVDAAYGICAVLVIITGVSRVIWGLKGPVFYVHNPIFWTKMALFLVVGLLSIQPTIHYLRINKDAGPEGVILGESPFRRTQSLLLGEAVLLAFIPLFATLMTHGYQ